MPLVYLLPPFTDINFSSSQLIQASFFSRTTILSMRLHRVIFERRLASATNHQGQPISANYSQPRGDLRGQGRYHVRGAAGASRHQSPSLRSPVQYRGRQCRLAVCRDRQRGTCPLPNPLVPAHMRELKQCSRWHQRHVRREHWTNIGPTSVL